MAQLHPFDATDLRCPEFTLPVRTFLEELPENDVAHIITKEERADLRLTHICAVYEWSLKGPIKKDDLIHFMITKTKPEPEPVKSI
jgi:TusA-related sulfurtransferase